MSKSPYDLEQSLYSRKEISVTDTHIAFFANHIGEFNKNGELITRADTNLYNSSTLMGNMYKVEGIRFRFSKKIDAEVIEHLLQYGYFTFRLVDRDVAVYPIHLMDNHFYLFRKDFKTPFVVNPYMNFSVMLSLDKPCVKSFSLTCELTGYLQRPQ